MITDDKKWHYLAVKNVYALLYENHDYCCIEITKGDSKILKYNHGEKSVKAPFIIYSDLESLLEKMSTCLNNPKKTSTTKINKDTSSGYSLFTHCLFDNTKNKLDYYRGHDCFKKSIQQK